MNQASFSSLGILWWVKHRTQSDLAEENRHRSNNNSNKYKITTVPVFSMNKHQWCRTAYTRRNATEARNTLGLDFQVLSLKLKHVHLSTGHSTAACHVIYWFPKPFLSSRQVCLWHCFTNKGWGLFFVQLPEWSITNRSLICKWAWYTNATGVYLILICRLTSKHLILLAIKTACRQYLVHLYGHLY